MMAAAALHPRFFFFHRPPTPPSTTSKLLPPSTAATHRSRSIRRPSAATTSPHNHHDSPPSAAAAAALDDYQLLFSSQPAESTDPLPLLATDGRLPADFPLGTYYLVGPGMIADSHGSAVNPLDGHGYLRAFRFIGGGAVMYSARYVETAAARDEREAETGRWRFRRPGLFSILKSRRTAPASNMGKNVANTTALRWGERLFCFWEGGLPYELEPASLATIGQADLTTAAEGQHREGGAAGVLLNLDAGITKPLLHVMMGRPPKRTLSHFKVDAQRNRLLLLCCDTEDIFLPQANFTFYEFDGDFELKQRKRYRIADQLMIHDWAFTDSHYIIIGNRVKIDVPGTVLAMAGLAPTISTITPNPSQPTTPIYLFPRYSEDKTAAARDWRIPVEAPSQLWTSHMGNAYEERNFAGNMEIKMHASVCSYRWFDYKKLFGYDGQSSKLDPSFMNLGQQGLPHLVQISIEFDDGGWCRRCAIAESSKHWKRCADFPVINPANSGRANRFMYASSASGSNEVLPHFPFDTVIKLHCSGGAVASWSAGSRVFVGEPMFVSRGTGDEEDGYVVVIEYAVSRRRCYLVVLDARKIGEEDAVVARLQVPEHLSFPLGFHGFWDAR